MKFVSANWNDAFDKTRAWLEACWRDFSNWAKRSEPWKPFLLVLFAAMVGIAATPVLLSLTIAGVVLGLVFLWVREFVFLMRTPGVAFPGRHDRWIWTAVFLVLPPLGAIAFCLFRNAEWEHGVPWGTSHSQKSREPWDEEGYV
jgi:hypothetical protein